MCDPISIGIGLAVATTAVSVVGQIQSANANNAAIKAQYKAKNKEIDQAATQEINDQLRNARREQGRIMVAAGESGLNTSSPVVEGLLQDAQMQASLQGATTLANRESRKNAARAEANTLMQSKPTLLGAGLQIALAGAKGAAGAGAFSGGGGGGGAAADPGADSIGYI